MAYQYHDTSQAIRIALACVIGTLRNACVSTASLMANAFGDKGPKGIVEEVRALAKAHEEKLDRALSEHMLDGTRLVSSPGHLHMLAVSTSGDGKYKKETTGAHTVGPDFWMRQGDLWSRIFAEQHAGLLRLVRSQEIELRNRRGQKRISLLEQDLLSTKGGDTSVADAEQAHPIPSTLWGDQQDQGLPSEDEVNEWQEQVGPPQDNYGRRQFNLRQRELVMDRVERRAKITAAKQESERSQLKAGAMALKAEADKLRWDN